MTQTEEFGTAGQPPKDCPVYGTALAALLDECAQDLESIKIGGLPNATSLRHLQGAFKDFLEIASAPSDIQFVIFWVDSIIADAFKNFFGDLISSLETDNARVVLCERLSNLFKNLSAALISKNEQAQMQCFKDYTIEYLCLVRLLNKR